MSPDTRLNKRSSSQPGSSTRATAPSTAPRSSRAVATQIDFLIAVIIIIAAISVYYLGAVILFETQAQNDQGSAHAGLRANERVADDILVNESGDTLLRPECSRAFFNKNSHPECNFSDPGAGQTYLRQVIGLGDSYTINVTMTDGTDIVNIDPSGGGSPFEHHVGDPIPRDRDVATYERTVSYGTDDDGDGDIDYYKLIVRVWGDA